jgi:Spy/CpxP family protein refolding chaperone
VAAANSAAPAASAQAAADAAEEEAVNEELRDYHRHHHHGGVTMFISMAIDTLGLDAAKKAQVEKIQTDLHTKMAPARDAEHDLLSTIADGVAAGKIDTAKVDAGVAKLATASAAIHTNTTDALTQLHDALSPIERATLVDKVKAHWDVWRKVNADEKAGSKEKGSHLAKLTEVLSLTPDQVDKITAALSTETPVTPQTDPKAVDAHIQAFSTAFVADKFDPKAIAPSATAAAGHVARHGGARLARFYEAITPVLTPEQRTKLAAHLRERLTDQHAA